MKGLLVTLFLVTAAQAQDTNIFWDTLEDIQVNIKPVNITPLKKGKIPLIVGGKEAHPHSFPFQVYLIVDRNTGKLGSCGGSLISHVSVLTAAHCIDNATSAEVILGAHNIRKKEESQVRLNSSSFIIHPNYDPNTILNDVAIIKLPKPVMLNENISLITLAAVSNSFTKKIANVSGWGKFSDYKMKQAIKLRSTSSEVVSDTQCTKSYPESVFSNIHICISGKAGKGSCTGDSGGPLTIQNKGKFVQIGVVSFGHREGCEVGHPSVYSRVTTYNCWILTNSGGTINYVAAGQQQLLMLMFLFYLFGIILRIQ